MLTALIIFFNSTKYDDASDLSRALEADSAPRPATNAASFCPSCASGQFSSHRRMLPSVCYHQMKVDISLHPLHLWCLTDLLRSPAEAELANTWSSWRLFSLVQFCLWTFNGGREFNVPQIHSFCIDNSSDDYATWRQLEIQAQKPPCFLAFSTPCWLWASECQIFNSEKLGKLSETQ